MNESSMPPGYEPQQYEDAIYSKWEKSGYFNPDNLPGERPEHFAVSMPPPNVTGVLHLGHALENTIMDIMVRYQRMQGKRALLIPGTDHSAVATQAKVEGLLQEEGIANPRQELGREGLLDRIWSFAEDSKSTILSQIRKMGTSADWSRLAYTFDDDRSKLVNEVFIRMYNDGLIYRGYRVVNWTVKGQSTCSDDELVYIDRPSKLYTFKYSKDFPITIATTRPETKLGDTAVAVHPNDERYKEYIGQTFTVDVGAAEPLNITVIADEGIDPKFGTGALGVTPAHSPIDFEMYQKNPDIGLIAVIGKDGRMTDACGPNYAGLTVEEAREKFVNWLRREGLLEKEEDITQNVGTSDRYKDVVEALPMEQWFIDVNKEVPGRGKTLKQLMKEAVTTGLDGDASKQVTITPDRFEKVYFNWIDNLRDWNISRQIWWGHRIPVWYKGKETVVSVASPGEGWTQDEDTLDTWFSSGMWTFSILGWPETSGDFANYHPNGWMQMGHEILFMWMARMILFSTYVLADIPFKEVYIHGMLRDKEGKKFSKSSGNGIDPLDVIAEYGTDALRMSLIKGIAPGNDSRFYEDKVIDSRNFVNKLWNISRFIDMQEDGGSLSELGLADKWILSRLHTTVQDMSADIDAYRFSQAAEKLYAFVWNDFANWYIEINKFAPNLAVAKEVLKTVLHIAHPFMPFVTEEIAEQIGVQGDHGLLMVAQWPQADSVVIDADLERDMNTMQELVTGIRAAKKHYGIAPKEEIQVVMAATEYTDLIQALAHVEVVASAEYTNSTQVIAGEWNATIPLDGLIDIDAERARLQKELDQIDGFLKGAEAKLSNKGYTQNAPAEVVEETRRLVEERKTARKQIEDALSQLQ